MSIPALDGPRLLREEALARFRDAAGREHVIQLVGAVLVDFDSESVRVVWQATEPGGVRRAELAAIIEDYSERAAASARPLCRALERADLPADPGERTGLLTASAQRGGRPSVPVPSIS